jgi:hypothetical protein
VGGFGLFRGFYYGIDLITVAEDNRVQLLLNLSQYARRVDARKVAVDVFVDDLDQGK